MNILKKIAVVLISTLLLITIAILIWWLLPARTPKIKGKNSIAQIEYLSIGGTEQCVLIRSNNVHNPILLFLHGGPGMPIMYMAHEFQRNLEENYTVVQWDRRGAGKTYSQDIPSPKSINTRQLVNDTYELIEMLQTRFQKEKVVLVGHSFGTYLGSIAVTERPELFSAYISIGQVVDDKKTRTLQESFIIEQAVNNKREDIIQMLEEDKEISLENWLFEFGGELKHSKTFFPLIWSGLKAPEYTVKEALDVAKGSSFSSTHINLNILDSTILHSIREYKVPVYFMVGKSDILHPVNLCKNIVTRLKLRKRKSYFLMSRLISRFLKNLRILQTH